MTPTPEQQRIRDLEDTVIELVNLMEDARIGFPYRHSTVIRRRISESRKEHPLGTRKRTGVLPSKDSDVPTAQLTPPPAAVEEETPA